MMNTEIDPERPPETPTEIPIGELYRFERFELDPVGGELWSAGERISLQQQPLMVLTLLVHHAGQVVPREAIQEAVWPDTVIDHEQAINSCVRQIRRALGDDARDPRFVETLPRRGYRFLVPVSRGGEAPPRHPPAVEPVPATPAPPSTGEAHEAAWATHGLPAGLQDRIPEWLRCRWKALITLVCSVLGFSLMLVGILTSTLKDDGRAAVTAPPERPLLAVLPFEDLGLPPEQAYLSAALAEELTVAFSRLAPEDLAVLDSVPGAALEADLADQLQWAAMLGADYLLHGSLRHADGRYRLTVRLTSVRDGLVLWADSFEPMSIVDDRVRNIVLTQVAGTLDLESLRLPPPGPANPRAQEAYLRGRYLLQKDGLDALEGARRQFERALELALDYTAAHTGLATALLRVPDNDTDRRSRARLALARARTLDPDNGEVLALTGELALWRDWDPTAAEKNFRLALKAEPHLALTHELYGSLLTLLGRHDEAIAHLDTAVELEPASPRVLIEAGRAYLYARRPEGAVRRCGQALSLAPESFGAHACLLQAHHLAGDQAAVLDTLAGIADHFPVPDDLRDTVARGDAAAGWRAYQRWRADTYRRRGEAGTSQISGVAFALAALGEEDEALDWLQRSAEAREATFLLAAVDPRLDGLRDHPRFQALLRRTGLLPLEPVEIEGVGTSSF